MKKIASGLILFMFLLPITVSAQTAEEVKQQKILIITQLISLLQQELALLMSISEANTGTNTQPQTPVTTSPEAPMVVGTPTPVVTPPNNTPTNTTTAPQVVCSVTAESNTGVAGSYITITWASDNATSGFIRNTRAAVLPMIIPTERLKAGSSKVLLSSETGEMNTIEVIFRGPGGTVTCQTQVLTQ